MNANGEVLGLIQKSASEEDKESYAIGASYGESLSISPLSANDINLNKIGIAKALPEQKTRPWYIFICLHHRWMPKTIWQL